LDTSNIDSARERIEGTVDQGEIVHVPKVGSACPIEVLVVNVLVPSEMSKVFHRACGPPSYIVCQLFQQREPAFAPAVPNCVGNLAPRNKDAIERSGLLGRVTRACARFSRRLIPDEIANVRQSPFLCRFDEPVVVKLANVIFNGINLLGNDTQQRLKGKVPFRIAHAIYRRQQLIEAINSRVVVGSH
jgi:hypothetical protein